MMASTDSRKKSDLEKHSRIVRVRDIVALTRHAKLIRNDYRTPLALRATAERMIEILARYNYWVD